MRRVIHGFRLTLPCIVQWILADFFQRRALSRFYNGYAITTNSKSAPCGGSALHLAETAVRIANSTNSMAYES